jgi:AcrR family transcriptional regulator
VIVALLEAAERLFSQRAPGSVSLRQIAAEAGVNFGLVYQHIGTRDQLVRAVFRHVSERASALIEQATTYQGALRALRQSNPGNQSARMRAWAILEGYRSDRAEHGIPPATEVLIARARDELQRLGLPADGKEAEIVTAVALSMHLGWKFYGPSFTVDLTAEEQQRAEQLAERVLDTVPANMPAS